MIPPADAERAVGIDCYVTEGAPCIARAKTTADDFGVEEQLLLEGFSSEDRADYFPLYRVEKRSIDTMHMAEELSDALGSRVSYGGMKDKRAAAVQYVTPTSLRSGRPQLITGDKFRATLVGYLPAPLSRRAVAGNKFAIVLRECCPEIGARIDEAMRLAGARRLPNFFGLQRFGSTGVGTNQIGKAIVRGEFESAVMRILLRETLPDREDGRAVGEAVAAGRYQELVHILPPGMDVEIRVAKELSRHPGAWVRALRAVPVRLRRLYVQAYQSWIFNRTVSRALLAGSDISKLERGDNWAVASGDGLLLGAVRGVRDPPTGDAVPMVQLVGFAYRDYGSRFDALIREVLESEGVNPGSFYVKELQEVSAEGGFRRPHMAIGSPSWSVTEMTATLEFTLAKGQYATVLLREIIKPEDPVAAGLA